MRLGLKKDEVRLEPYQNHWLKAFEHSKKEILKHTTIPDERIAHIGSTAIENMPAKPIIDILIGVDKLTEGDQVLFQGLKEAGFLRLRVERPQEIVCAKFTDNTFESKTHFIHLVEYKGELWKDLIFFRDYLNSDVLARVEYARLKEEYVSTTNEGIGAYTDHKEAFVKHIFAKRKA